MKNIIPLIVYLLVYVQVFGSVTDMDSLKQTWYDQQLSETTRIEVAEELIKHYMRFSNDSAERVAKEFLRLSSNKKNGQYRCTALIMMARVMGSKGDPIAALDLLEEGLEIAKKANDITALAATYSATGTMFSLMDNNTRALENYLEALKLFEELGDTEDIEYVVKNIGVCFVEMGDFEKAREYYNKGLRIVEDNGFTERIPSYLISMGNLYGRKNSDTIDAQLSLKYYREILAWQDSSINQKYIAAAYHNIGLTHWNYLNNLDSALIYFTKALEKKETIGWISSLNSSQIGLGGVNSQLGRYKQALTWCKIAYEGARESKELISEIDGCNCLYVAYKGLGKLDSALKYHEYEELLKDSLVDIDREKEINRQELGYQFEKKALADSLAFVGREAILKAETKKQRIGLLGAAVGLLLLVALAFSIYKGKKRSDELLLNILPEETAKELKQKGYADARQFDEVTVLFTDFKGFTQISEKLSPTELVSAIDECFKAFDEIINKYNIEKIKTIGDAYMAAGGLPVPNKTNAQDVVNAALEMRDWMLKYKERKGDNGFEIRIGIHTGPVVAGIVGIKKFQYDIWGDTVNTASRMESSGEVGKVNISQTTYELVNGRFNCESRGKVQAKGKGEIEMYFVEAKA